MANDQEPNTATDSTSIGRPRRIFVVDPSEAVTGLGFVFGAIGVLVGIVSAVVLSPDLSFGLLGYCAVAALAGGSAGVVIGGMVGAIIAVAKGVSPARHGRDRP